MTYVVNNAFTLFVQTSFSGIKEWRMINLSKGDLLESEYTGDYGAVTFKIKRDRNPQRINLSIEQITTYLSPWVEANRIWKELND